MLKACVHCGLMNEYSAFKSNEQYFNKLTCSQRYQYYYVDSNCLHGDTYYFECIKLTF